MQTSPLIKHILENTGRFTVDVSTTPPAAPHHPTLPANATPEQKAKFDEATVAAARIKQAWTKWRPKFGDYAAVVSNYNGEDWPDEVKKAFVDYVKNGGGFVSVHAANNAFADWPEYNQMIGLGGWGGRTEKSGPYLHLRDGKFIKEPVPGPSGGHGKQHEFLIVNRAPEHPIMQGLPAKWMHATDELYHTLRGPAENITVLGSAYSSKDMGGTGEDEPLLMVLPFGKGRVFHTALGHSTTTMQGVEFQITLQRGTEWAATGKVTLPAPKAEEMPADKVVMRDLLVK